MFFLFIYAIFFCKWAFKIPILDLNFQLFLQIIFHLNLKFHYREINKTESGNLKPTSRKTGCK